MEEKKTKHHLGTHKTESRIQQEIVLWFNNTYCLKCHNPRGIIMSVPNESRSKEETMYKKNIGLLPGASDLVVCKPCGEIVFVEVKDEKGRQRENQQDFQQRVESLGYRYLLVRSLEEFKKQIQTQ